MLPRLLALALFFFVVCAISQAADAPKFVEKDGRWALLVDGQPYLPSAPGTSTNLPAERRPPWGGKAAYSAFSRRSLIGQPGESEFEKRGPQSQMRLRF